jgi:hypothetical protein
MLYEDWRPTLGRTGGFSLVLPYALIDTSAGPFRASTNGVSDVGFLWQMNIFGGPALTREQFQSFIPQTFSSFHLLVTTPLGFYQPSSPINPSANRWMVSPTVNFSYTPDEGWTWVETYVSGGLFTDNDNYRVYGAQTLSQKPILRLEEHVSRNVTDALWLSLDAFYNVGGETSIDGLGQDKMANTLRLGAPAWACVYGVAPTLASTTSAWSPNPRANLIRRPCASPSGNCGEACRLPPRHDPARKAVLAGRPLGVERTRSRLFLGQRLPAQSTPSSEDRFVPLPARSQGRF